MLLMNLARDVEGANGENLTLRQLAMLEMVCLGLGNSVRSISESLELSPAVVSRGISVLCERGLVAKMAEPIDGRGMVCVPTHEGVDLARVWLKGASFIGTAETHTPSTLCILAMHRPPRRPARFSRVGGGARRTLNVEFPLPVDA